MTIIFIVLAVAILIGLFFFQSNKKEVQVKGFTEDVLAKRDSISSTVVMLSGFVFGLAFFKNILTPEAQMFLPEIISLVIAIISTGITYIMPLFNRS